jgi:hypothetical protein
MKASSNWRENPTTGHWESPTGKSVNGPVIALRDISGTAATLALDDAGTTLHCTSGSATTITVPLNSSVAFPLGSVVYVLRWGAGSVAIAAAGGVTIRYLTGKGLNIAGQYAQAMLTKIGTDEWLLTGELSP